MRWELFMDAFNDPLIKPISDRCTCRKHVGNRMIIIGLSIIQSDNYN